MGKNLSAKERLLKLNNNSTRVPGHGLVREGRPHRANGEQMPAGSFGNGLCSCGAVSGMLETDGARRAWHTAHKLDVVTGAV